MDFPPVVDLLVGKDPFTVALSTLRKFPDSMLAAMFSGRMGVFQKDGACFIDRPGNHFPVILEYLRDGSVDLPADPSQLRKLLKEAQYYGLIGLEERVQATLDRVKVRVDIYKADFGCTDAQCNCGGAQNGQGQHPPIRRVVMPCDPVISLDVEMQVVRSTPGRGPKVRSETKTQAQGETQGIVREEEKRSSR